MKSNYILISFLVLFTITAITSEGFSGRVVSWQFDETSGAIAGDSSGNGFDGILGDGFAAVTDYWQPDAGRTGQPGDGALYLSGDPNLIVTATDVDLSGTGLSDIFSGGTSWTINIWIKFDGTPGMCNIGGFGDCEWDEGTVGQTDRYFASFDGGYEFEIGDDGFWPGNALTSDWQMLTVTYDAAAQKGKAYYNGELVEEKSGLILADTEENAIKINSFGKIVYEEYGSSRTWLTAWVDDFSIWDEVLQDHHVKGMYEGDFISCSGALAADLNGDCEVDVEDFAILAADWLVCNMIPADSCD